MRAVLLGFSILSVVAVAACNDPGARPDAAGRLRPAKLFPAAGAAVRADGDRQLHHRRHHHDHHHAGGEPRSVRRHVERHASRPARRSRSPFPPAALRRCIISAGESQPMGSTEMRGQTLRANFAPAGNGYIELTPQADGRMIYFFNSNQTTANLVLEPHLARLVSSGDRRPLDCLEGPFSCARRDVRSGPSGSG